MTCLSSCRFLPSSALFKPGALRDKQLSGDPEGSLQKVVDPSLPSPGFRLRHEETSERNSDMQSKNTNCLVGMQCPNCKSLGPFSISATAIFTFSDDGTESFGDVEYDGGSYCLFIECEHDGIVHDFNAVDQDRAKASSGPMS
jgi:hypothetical protein